MLARDARSHPSSITSPIWAPVQVTGLGDREVARVASAQKGVVSRRQLLDAGITRSAIQHRLNHGRLHPYPRGAGVYLVGRSSPEPLGAEMAAVLRFGGHAVLSHRTAAAIWGFGERPDGVTVTTVTRSLRSRPGMQVFRVGGLDRRDVRQSHRLPITAPARTLLDVAGCVPVTVLERMLAEARVRGLVRDAQLWAAIERAPHRTGVAALRSLLESERGPALTRSEAERKLLSMIESAGLPRPLVNSRIRGIEVDLLWPAAKLVVEMDGYQFHSSRRAFERDRRRDQVLVSSGMRVIRVTWRQLVDEPLAVIASIAQAVVATP